jgi:thiol:disulfide interchange protein DsbD
MDNIFSYFWVSFGFGFISLLNPCVFPLIPLTISTFTPKEDEPKRNYILESIIYSFGIVFSFSVIGVLFSIFFGASGITKLATHPALNLAIGFLFLFFASTLLGFEFYLPVWIVNFYNKLNNNSNSSGYTGILIRGFIISITTFTCTMPFVGSILVTASKGDWFYPLVGMFGYGLAFSIPFTLLSLFPGILKFFPKSGNWNAKFRGTLGILEIIASLKFFSNADLILGSFIINRNVFLIITIILFFVLFLYLLNVVHSPNEVIKPDQKLNKYNFMFSFIVAFFTIYLTTGIFGRNLGEFEAYLPPSSFESVNSSEKIVWLKDLHEAKLISEKSNKPILVNFTGWSCANCRWMENNILNKPEVEKILSSFVLVELYTDGDNPEEEKNQEYLINKFKTFGIPYYASMDQYENVFSSHEGTTRDVNTFIEFLQKKDKL